MWVYSGPNSITMVSSFTVEDGGDIEVYSTLPLSEYDDPYGEWLVSIDINGNLMRTDTFIVEGRTGVGIPIPVWMIAIGIGTAVSAKRKKLTGGGGTPAGCPSRPKASTKRFRGRGRPVAPDTMRTCPPRSTITRNWIASSR